MNLSSALEIFGLKSTDGLSTSELKVLYRRLAKDRHPDRTGGGSDEFIQLQIAYTLLRKELSTAPETDSTDNSSNRKTQPQDQKTAENQTASDLKTSGSETKSKAEVKYTSHQGYSFSQSKEEISSTTPSDINLVDTPTSPTDIAKLSKDEILTKYREDTKGLQTKLSSLIGSNNAQKTILLDVQNEVSTLSVDYANQLKSLQIRVQQRIEALEKNLFQRFWLKYFFTPITGKDSWDYFRSHIETYEKEREQLKLQFNEKLVEIYGKSLNSMTKYLETTSE